LKESARSTGTLLWIHGKLGNESISQIRSLLHLVDHHCMILRQAWDGAMYRGTVWTNKWCTTFILSTDRLWFMPVRPTFLPIWAYPDGLALLHSTAVISRIREWSFFVLPEDISLSLPRVPKEERHRPRISLSLELIDFNPF
jgi:hypothetical protein